jgi:hypothetical protein
MASTVHTAATSLRNETKPSNFCCMQKLARDLPTLLHVGFPLLGTVISVLVSLFWPDVAGPPPVTLDQVCLPR